MTDNPNTPDPRIGEISKALDDFEQSVLEYAYSSGPTSESYICRFARNDARTKLMNLIRRLIDHV